MAAVAGIAALVVAIQIIPYGHDYAEDRRQIARDREPGFGTDPEDGEDATIPASLIVEHRELHATLQAVTALPGTTGMAARYLADLMDEHFKSEEEFAMPPLALLRPLAGGEGAHGLAQTAIAMSDRLKAGWPRMLHEHEVIREAGAVLAVEARVENHPDVLRFVEKLKLHAQQEEEILYPAAILVGEYLKLKGSE
jgi:hypothetical protein